jgi:hypothetical protein
MSTHIMTFAEFLTHATHQPQPYGWQCRIAGGETADPQGRFTHGTAYRSRLISIPSVLVKTTA